jgi:outer membrane lipase/esterase
MKPPFLSRFLVCVLLIFPLSAFALPFNSLYVFGDSLSDTGNAAAYAGIDLPWPYHENRISNGPLAVDALAAQLGLNADPYLLGGTNFAVAGARAGRMDLGDLSYQLGAFSSGGYDPSDALSLVFIGGNDVRKAASEADDTVAAGILGDALMGVDFTIRSLIAAGAQQILVPNVFDIGLIPESALAEAMYSGYQARASALTAQYNMALAANLAMIEFDTGIDLMEFDLFGFGQNVIANAGNYGITNTTDSCLLEGFEPSLPKPECDFETYAFFDTIHPTAKFHGLIGNALAATVTTVPEPASIFLFGLGLVGMGMRVKLSRSRSGRE